MYFLFYPYELEFVFRLTFTDVFLFASNFKPICHTFQKERLLKERQEAFKNEIETMSGVLKAQLDTANKKYAGNVIPNFLSIFFPEFYTKVIQNFEHKF